MKGYTPSSTSDLGAKSEDTSLQPWEQLITDAIANVIEFWGFKRNHGRVWALLYLHGRPFCATEIQHVLGLSKGAVSMIIRELEWWKVVNRVRVSGNSSWHFVAETDLTAMITHVISEREKSLVAKTKEDLVTAEDLMKNSADVSPEMVERIAKLRGVAGFIDKALILYLKSARLEWKSVLELFKDMKHSKQEETVDSEEKK